MAQTTTQNSIDSSTPPSNGSEGTRTVAIVVGVVACVALLIIIIACYCIIKKRKPSPPPIDNTTTAYRKDSLFIEYDSSDVICKKQGPVANRADNSGFYSIELSKQARLPTKQILSGHAYAGEHTEMTVDVKASPFNKKVEMTQKELEEEATFTY